MGDVTARLNLRFEEGRKGQIVTMSEERAREYGPYVTILAIDSGGDFDEPDLVTPGPEPEAADPEPEPEAEAAVAVEETPPPQIV